MMTARNIELCLKNKYGIMVGEKKLEDLKQKVRKCKKCSLWKTRINALPGEGNSNARVMLVAQAPGENED
ncbi:hypothetical protein KA005_14520, partial [bacterium]|nr:hypothetical protein [bacterium]